MKKHLILPLLVCIAVLSACAQSRQAAKGSESKPVAKAPAKKISSVTMKRGACFGRCPEYSITINSGGLAEYEGRRNADPQGVYQKNIGADKAQELLRECMSYRVDTCKDLYTAHIADLPGLYYSFIIDGKEKKIGNAHFGPHYLITLSQQIDALGKVDGSWKKVKDKPAE